MDLEKLQMCEVSQTEKKISHDITHMWNLKKKAINELTYKTEIESQM